MTAFDIARVQELLFYIILILCEVIITFANQKGGTGKTTFGSPAEGELKDTILFFETSEEIPDANYVYRVLMGMGERGSLKQFKAVLVGRPKAWEFDKPYSPEQKITYKQQLLSCERSHE